jgi:hypothetical protein
LETAMRESRGVADDSRPSTPQKPFLDNSGLPTVHELDWMPCLKAVL